MLELHGVAENIRLWGMDRPEVELDDTAENLYWYVARQRYNRAFFLVIQKNIYIK